MSHTAWSGIADIKSYACVFYIGFFSENLNFTMNKKIEIDNEGILYLKNGCELIIKITLEGINGLINDLLQQEYYNSFK